MGASRILQPVLMDSNTIASGLVGELFEETIDGYFPLHVSLNHMLERTGYASAVVTLQYAPIMHIPGLTHNAPVPLNIKTGLAGMIEKMSFCVTRNTLCGSGNWQWLQDENSSSTKETVTLDSMTRLAEPCYLTGCGFASGTCSTSLLGSVCQSKQGKFKIVKQPEKRESQALIWGPFKPSRINFVDSPFAMHNEYGLHVHDAKLGHYIIHGA